MFSFFDSHSPRRLRHVTPQVETLENIISLTTYYTNVPLIVGGFRGTPWEALEDIARDYCSDGSDAQIEANAQRIAVQNYDVLDRRIGPSDTVLLSFAC